jgi:uncharacterized membrane protein required for colicin V production
MGVLDRPFGFIFGLMRGIVVIAVFYVGILILLESEDRFPESVLSSASIATVRVVATTMMGFAPEEIQAKVEGAIPKQDLDDVKDSLTTITEDAAEDVADDASDLLPDEKITPLLENN